MAFASTAGIVVSLFLTVVAGALSPLDQARIYRGVQVQHKAQYDSIVSKGAFSCFSKPSGELPLSVINDEYCDCEDGSDEPGTSACTFSVVYKLPSDWKFHCTTQTQKVKKEVFHSRVNDGICDCCDGSDEYLQHVSCPNTCAEAAEKEERETAERKARHDAGLAAKEKLIERGTKRRADKEAELAKKRGEMIAAEIAVGETEKVKESEEQLEKGEREAIKQKSLEAKALWDIEQEKKKAESTPEKVADQLGVHFICSKWRQTIQCKGNAERDPSSDKECDQLIAAGWSGYCECFDTVAGVEVKHEKDCGHLELNCAYVCKFEGKEGITREGLDTATTAGGAGTNEEQFKLDDGSGHFREEANQARNRNSEAVNTKNSLHSSIVTLEGELKDTFTPALLALQDECFDKDAGQYTYSLCLFKDVKQKPRSGHGDTVLGYWKGFGEQSYSVWGATQDVTHMQFKDGSHCWNGPARSVDVHVVCGADNIFLSIDEPSMCTYKAVFQTPAVCEGTIDH